MNRTPYFLLPKFIREGSSSCYDANAIPTRSRYAGIRTPPRSLEDMDGRGWGMVSRVSVGGAGRSGDG